jgi:D-glycero-alpha-D-manno-heptose 1-phosphate guanylyltransferase
MKKFNSDDVLEAMVLAGGLGSRIKAVVPDLPKSMADIKGAPFLQLLLDELIKKNFKRVVLAVGYKHQVIMNHFGSRYRTLDLDYNIEDRPLGTGGAVKNSFCKCKQENVFILNGDTIADFDPLIMLQFAAHKKPNVMAARSVNDVSRFGKVSHSDGIVTALAEKSSVGAGLINSGIYLLNRSVFAMTKYPFAFSLEHEVLPLLIRNRELAVCEFSGNFIDIGVPSDLSLARKIL